MEDKFQNKYRISSARLPGWDYGWNAAYFVTICTKDRENFFGEIISDNMILSKTGVIADLMWYEIKNHSKNIELGDFIVMPNHMHGIITLNENDSPVETRHALSLQKTPKDLPAQQRLRNQGKNTLSSIIGGYKAAVTKHANRLKFDFGWQPRFHDHIIRDEKSLQMISNYIINNPRNWQQDKFFRQ
jgi:REP element-mobilizing transposase RayT